MPHKVLIVKSNLEPFREPFFSGLHRRLAAEGVALRVAVPGPRCGTYAGEWLIPVASREFRLFSKEVIWQDVRHLARGANLVIAQQGARQLINYWLLLRRREYGYQFALWGHGREFQRAWSTPLSEFVKRTVFRDVDYWFAYTPRVAGILAQAGYPADRICAVYNSIDTRSEAALHRAVGEAEKQAVRERWSMAPSAALVSYCGALYRSKRMDLLVSACAAVRRAGIDLHLAIIGDGKERAKLERASARERWIHVVGSAYGREKARLLAASAGMVIPGVVGLAVVDAFAHECPLITTRTRGHGPEIEYLIGGINGLITSENAAAFSGGIQRLLTDAALRRRLQQGCRESAAQITIENMIERFAQGVHATLRRAC